MGDPGADPGSVEIPRQGPEVLPVRTPRPLPQVRHRGMVEGPSDVGVKGQPLILRNHEDAMSLYVDDILTSAERDRTGRRDPVSAMTSIRLGGHEEVVVAQGSGPLELPHDQLAEQIVTGVAIDSPCGARSVARLEIADFLNPTLGRLWAAATNCSVAFTFDGARTKAVAAAAGVPHGVAEKVRNSIPVLSDGRGWWVRRVRDARLRRRLMAELVEIVNALGCGASLEETIAEMETSILNARRQQLVQVVRREAA